MFTNYYTRQSNHACPECGGTLRITLKREATAFKYWFECQNRDDCGFEGPTRRGPNFDEDDLYDDEKVNELADETAEYAKENASFD